MSALRSLIATPRSEPVSRFPSMHISASSARPRGACISFKPAAERNARLLHAARYTERAIGVAGVLAPDQYEIRSVGSLEALFDAMLSFAPDLLLVDDDFQDLNVNVLCSQLEVMAMVSQPRIVFLSSGEIHEDATAAVLLGGADDYVSANRGTELRARIRVALRRSGQSLTLARVRRERNKLQYLAFIDGLTGVPNRRSLEAVLERQVRRGEGLAILFVDIDHFKAINDQFGHAEGDRVLRNLAHSLKGTLRPGDFLCRYGGEEFVIVAPGIGRESVFVIAERHRARLAESTLSSIPGLRVTASVGADVLDPGESGIEAVLRRADEALYDAKRRGRNQTVLARRPTVRALEGVD